MKDGKFRAEVRRVPDRTAGDVTEDADEAVDLPAVGESPVRTVNALRRVVYAEHQRGFHDYSEAFNIDESAEFVRRIEALRESGIRQGDHDRMQRLELSNDVVVLDQDRLKLVGAWFSDGHHAILKLVVVETWGPAWWFLETTEAYGLTDEELDWIAPPDEDEQVTS